MDRSIVFSFDASGFRRHAAQFRSEDLDVDLTGRTALVTGANAGIGRATARGLAERGATVYLLCRNPERGESAQAELRKETQNSNIHFEPLDVCRLSSVRSFAERFSAQTVDILVHNAGVLLDELSFTEDDQELTWATNVFGPFALSFALEERLRRARGRVIWVSSGGMYTQRLELSDLRWQRSKFDGVVAYAQTKRAEVILTEMMAAHWQAQGITVNAMHPGWADTRSVRQSLPRFHKVTKSILRNAEQGADTVVWLAACPRLEAVSGRFWFDRSEAPPHLMKRTVETASDRERLWALCTSVTQTTQ